MRRGVKRSGHFECFLIGNTSDVAGHGVFAEADRSRSPFVRASGLFVFNKQTGISGMKEDGA